jgi:heme oxygenase
MEDKSEIIKQSLKETLKDLHKKIGRIPRTIDVQNDRGNPSYITYVKYFGSWKKALEESGISPGCEKGIILTKIRKKKIYP